MSSLTRRQRQPEQSMLSTRDPFRSLSMDPFRSLSDPFRMSDLVRRDPFRLMRDLLRWDPFSDVESLLLSTQEAAFVPDISIKETPDAIELTADVPGIPEDNIDISVSGNRLTISGKREEEEREEGEQYLSYERNYGSFYRSFVFPENVDLENVSADLKNGVLHVRIPRKEGRQARRIKLGGEAGRMGAGPTEAGQMETGRTQGTAEAEAAGATAGASETTATGTAATAGTTEEEGRKGSRTSRAA